MRDDTNKNTEEAVVETTVEETTDMQTKTDELQNAEEAVVETLGPTNRRVLKSLTIEGTAAENENARTDELQNTEEAVVEATVQQEESLTDWVDSVIAEYELHFDAWVVENGESPVLCIKAIRGDKVSGTARVNVANRNRRSVSIAIQSVIKEVLPTYQKYIP